jgi:hypothetical protein
MNSLDFRLKPLLSTYSSEEIVREAELLLVDAEVGVSFWGNRILTVRGCEGSVYLDTIANKILGIVNVPLEGEERDRIIALRGKIQNFYTESDRLVQTANQNAHWFVKIVRFLDFVIN